MNRQDEREQAAEEILARYDDGKTSKSRSVGAERIREAHALLCRHARIVVDLISSKLGYKHREIAEYVGLSEEEFSRMYWSGNTQKGLRALRAAVDSLRAAFVPLAIRRISGDRSNIITVIEADHKKGSPLTDDERKQASEAFLHNLIIDLYGYPFAERAPLLDNIPAVSLRFASPEGRVTFMWSYDDASAAHEYKDLYNRSKHILHLRENENPHSDRRVRARLRKRRAAKGRLC